MKNKYESLNRLKSVCSLFCNIINEPFNCSAEPTYLEIRDILNKTTKEVKNKLIDNSVPNFAEHLVNLLRLFNIHPIHVKNNNKLNYWKKLYEFISKDLNVLKNEIDVEQYSLRSDTLERLYKEKKSVLDILEKTDKNGNIYIFINELIKRIEEFDSSKKDLEEVSKFVEEVIQSIEVFKKIRNLSTSLITICSLFAAISNQTLPPETFEGMGSFLANTFTSVREMFLYKWVPNFEQNILEFGKLYKFKEKEISSSFFQELRSFICERLNCLQSVERENQKNLFIRQNIQHFINGSPRNIIDLSVDLSDQELASQRSYEW